MKLFGAFRRQARGDHFLLQHLGLGRAADDADEGEIPLGERALEHGAVEGVSLGQAEQEGVTGHGVDQFLGKFAVQVAGVAGPRQFVEPLAARVHDGELAVERGEHGHERLHDMAGAENPNGPRRHRAGAGVGLEVKPDRAAAGHADIGPQGPVHTVRPARAVHDHLLCQFDGPGLELAAADCAAVQTGGGDEHPGPGILRGAAARLGQDNEHEGRAFVFEGHQLLVEGAGFRHRCADDRES